MEKILALAVLLVPVAAIAQTWRPGGGGIQGGPRPGGGFGPTAGMDELAAQAEMARDRVDYAADLLYPAAETVFSAVAEVRTLPPLSTTWDGVNAALADAFDDLELAVAEGQYRLYVREFEACRAAFDEAWDDRDAREEICEGSASFGEPVLSAREDIEAAVEISKEAKEDLKDLADHLRDLRDMPRGMPGMGGMPARPESEVAEEHAVAADLEEIEEARRRADEQIELGESLLKKLDKML